jgi:hypothetical protein
MLYKTLRLIFFSVLSLSGFLAAAQSFSVAPYTWYKGQTITVAITGYKTNFKTGTGTSVVKFTQGTNTTIYPNYFTATSDTSISAGFSVSNFVPTGYYTGFIYDAYNGAISQSNAIYVAVKPTPSITKVYPDTIRLGQTLSVSITGQNTNFGVGTSTTTAWFQQGTNSIIYPTSVIANASTNLTANTKVPASANTGYYSTYVTNSIDGTIHLSNSIYVSPAGLPYIKSFTPDTAAVGQSVKIRITGVNTRFGTGQNPTYATLSLSKNSKDTLFGYSNTINSINSMSCYFTIPANADTGYYNLNIYDTYDGHLISTSRFHIYKYLTRLLSINPTASTTGASLSVTVTGYNTNFTTGTGSIVWFSQGTQTIHATKNTAVASDTIHSDFTIPSSAKTGYYDVNTNDSTDGDLILMNGFYIYAASIPRITGINPSQTSAAAFYSPTISTFATKYSSVGIKSVWLTQGSAKITSTNNIVSNDTTIKSRFYFPSTASGYYKLFVLSNKGDTLTLPNAVNVLPVFPFIDSILPGSAFQKQSLNVTLFGKYTSFNSGSAAVWLSKGTNKISPIGNIVYSDSVIRAAFKIPSKALTGYWDVNVKDIKDDTLTRTNGFYINPAPNAVIVSDNPDSAMQGKSVQVKITGSNTWFTSGSINAWLTQGTGTINSTTISAINDTLVQADFSIPSTAALGLYDLNVSDALDGNMLKSNGFLVTHNSGINPVTTQGLYVNAYPNPFGSDIQVQYSISKNSPVTLDLYDITGKKILSDSYGNQPAGSYVNELHLSAKSLTPGIYFIRLQAGEYLTTIKIFKMN